MNTGLVKCCGVVPLIKTSYIECPNCHAKASTLPSSIEYLSLTWNTNFQKIDFLKSRQEMFTIMPIDAPDGYHWAELDITYLYLGGQAGKRLPFILFKHEIPLKDMWFGRQNVFNSLSLMRINHETPFELSLGRKQGLAAYISSTTCSDNTGHFTLRLQIFKEKALKEFQEVTGINIEVKD